MIAVSISGAEIQVIHAQLIYLYKYNDTCLFLCVPNLHWIILPNIAVSKQKYYILEYLGKNEKNTWPYWKINKWQKDENEKRINSFGDVKISFTGLSSHSL